MRPFLAACLAIVMIAVAAAAALDGFVQHSSSTAFAEPSARI